MNSFRKLNRWYTLPATQNRCCFSTERPPPQGMHSRPNRFPTTTPAIHILSLKPNQRHCESRRWWRGSQRLRHNIVIKRRSHWYVPSLSRKRGSSSRPRNSRLASPWLGVSSLIPPAETVGSVSFIPMQCKREGERWLWESNSFAKEQPAKFYSEASVGESKALSALSNCVLVLVWRGNSDLISRQLSPLCNYYECTLLCGSMKVWL